MKDLLTKLTRDELIDLGHKYIENFSSKSPNHVLIKQLSKLEFDEEDKVWLEKLSIDNEAEELPNKNVKNIEKVNTNTAFYDENGNLLSTNEIEQKANAKGKAEISAIIAEAKRKSNKMVIVHITPLSKEDIAMNKSAELFITGNAYFTISALVPFNVYVEVPRAIAEVAKESTCLNVVSLNQFEQNSRKFRPIALGNMNEKYNVQIWTKDEFARIQSRQLRDD